MTPEFNRLKDCRHGRMLYNFNDCYVGRSYDYYGEWKENELKLLLKIIRPGWVILDIGANIGQHSLPFAQAAGSDGAVLAFEPQRLFFQTLCANMALNHVARACCHPVAVGATCGSIKVSVRQPWMENFNYAALTLRGVQHADAEEVRLITVDSLGLGRCNFIKIEVVGMELDVLQGAQETIRALHPILFVENDAIGAIDGPLVQPGNRERSRDLIRFLDALDYDQYWHVAPYFNPDNFFKNPENVFGKSAALNMLCVPRGRGHTIGGLQKVDVPA